MSAPSNTFTKDQCISQRCSVSYQELLEHTDLTMFDNCKCGIPVNHHRDKAQVGTAISQANTVTVDRGLDQSLLSVSSPGIELPC